MHFDQWNPLTNVIVENIAKFKKFKIGHNSKGMQYIVISVWLWNFKDGGS